MSAPRRPAGAPAVSSSLSVGNPGSATQRPSPTGHGTAGTEGRAGPGTSSIQATVDKPNDGAKEDIVDAGLRSMDHYKRALPRWRYSLRQRLLPLVRWETPYLAYFQSNMRSPALDNYFAITANLGTHTFFMIGLPMLFWFGYTEFGKGLVHILATGVFFSGFIKDMCSLPRPLSPPLQRITMSDSVALEYGFPSTHSTNAVSVAVYGLLHLANADFAPMTTLFLQCLGYFYAISIVVGRLYCGMHGFVDVIFGSLLGTLLGLIEFYWGPALDAYMQQSSWIAPLTAALAVIILVRIHPEPADDCPCFDDSVAFAGVMIGLEVGTWHVSRLRDFLALTPQPHHAVSWPVIVARLVSGVLIIFAWREIMKPTLLKGLPYLFRVMETFGLDLPRRFFKNASEYGNIPEVLRLRTDNVIPSVSDIPGFVRNIQNTRRGRSVSIGPQSAADAYETLAYRERRRRESVSSQTSVKSKGSFLDLRDHAEAHAGTTNSFVDGSSGHRESNGMASERLAHKRSLAQFEEMMGRGMAEAPAGHEAGSKGGEANASNGRQEELNEKEMFENIVRPRVKYDVEVVTKLVVYTGIAWLAVEFIPIMFEIVG